LEERRLYRNNQGFLMGVKKYQNNELLMLLKERDGDQIWRGCCERSKILLDVGSNGKYFSPYSALFCY
jgi:hypothetical protein